MSLILEALKKSEAERRLGRAPDLLTPVAAPLRERRPWVWLWGVVFGLAAVLVLVLALWARSALRAPLPEPGTTAQPSAAAVLAPPAAEASATHLTPATSSTRPAPAAPRTPADVIANVPLPQNPDFAGTERESLPVPAAAIPLPAPAPEPAQAPQATVARPPATPATPAPLPTPAVVPAADPAEPATSPALEPIQHLSTLPVALREGLPPLRLSMHVYDPDPAARFVLIDGKRYRQGDAIATGIVIDAIRPDGVAIARDGTRFLISRP